MTTPTLEPADTSGRAIDWLVDVLRGGDPTVVVSRRRAPSSHVEIERYTVFPNDDDPRLLITSSSNKVRAAALRRIGSQTGTVMRVARLVGAELARAGLDQLATGSDIVLSVPATAVAEAPGDRAPLTLVEELERAIGEPGLHVAATIGPLRPNRKPVLQVMDADGRLVAYAKIGWDDSTRRMVDREAEVLADLGSTAFRNVRTPDVIHIGTWRDLRILVTEPLDHSDIGMPGDALVATALEEITFSRGRRTGCLSDSAWISVARSRAEAADHPTLLTSIDRLVEAIGDERFDFGVSHGDWAPWNMVRLGRHLGVWDWERACSDAPVGIDVVHHRFQQAFAANDQKVRHSLRVSRQAIEADLERIGIDTERTPDLMALYLVELALRYAESGVGAADITRVANDIDIELSRVIDVIEHGETEPAGDGTGPTSIPRFGRRMLGGSGVPAPVREAVKGSVKVYGRVTSDMRVLPNTFIIGAQRAGTTSLFRYLTQHSSITGPMLEKGVHYFDTNYSNGLDWYRSHFPTERTARLSRQRNGCDLRVVEACPYYLFHPQVPDRIAEVIDDAKFIALVREPGSRALSHHNHEVKRGFETEDFETALDLEKERLDGTADELAADPHHVSYAHQHHSYVARGHYEEQLARYDATFGNDRLLVLRTADLEAEPAATVARALEFLEVNLSASFTFPRFNARAYEAMDADLEHRLREEFAPTDEAISSLLGLDHPWQ